MKKNITSFILGFAVLTSGFSQTRYVDEVFSSVDVTTDIVYAQNFSVLAGTPIPTGMAGTPIPALAFDLYEPTGDTETSRPLIIHLHTGTFAPVVHNGNPTGLRQDFATDAFCKGYAKRGYVVANLEYRLGWNPNMPTEPERAADLMKAVYRAIQDTKAAVRFFRKDFETNSNSYGIDTSRIILSGQGSGGWVALGYATVDKLAEIQLPKFLDGSGVPLIDTAVLGDWNGVGGSPSLNMPNSPGYSNDVHMVCSMGGGLGDLSWLEAGDVPIAAVHGPLDAVAIYTTGNVSAGGVNVTTDISGAHDVVKKANMLGNNDPILEHYDAYTLAAKSASNALVAANATDWGGTAITETVNNVFPFITGNPGEGSPWDYWDSTFLVTQVAPAVGLTAAEGQAAHASGLQTNPDMSYGKALAYIDSTLSYFCPRIVNATMLPGNTTEIIEANTISDVSVFPNPSSGNLVFSSNSGNIESIKFHNAVGQLTKAFNPNASIFNIENVNMPTGIYLVEIICKGNSIVQKIVIE